MKNKHLKLVIVSIILIVAALTNPSQEKHKEVVKNKLNSHMQQSITNNPKINTGLGHALGGAIFGGLVNGVVEIIVSRENYVLFSTTKINWAGQTKVIGVGAFGYVYVTRELDEALDEGLLNSWRN